MTPNPNAIATQTGDPPTLCRFLDNSAGPAYVNYDTAPTAYAFLATNPTAFPLWAELNDWLYIGKASPFAFTGFSMAIAGVGYTAFVVQYSCGGGPYNLTAVSTANKKFTVATDVSTRFKAGSNFAIHGSTGNDATYTCASDAVAVAGPATEITVSEVVPDATVDGHVEAGTIWTKLTVIDDSTDGFTKTGYLAWVVPGLWATRTVDSGVGYWIRARQSTASPATPAQAYHLLPSVQFDAPIKFQPEISMNADDFHHYDINGTLRPTDHGDVYPYKVNIDCTPLALRMMEVNLLRYWLEKRKRLYILDLSYTDPPSLTTDAYYKSFSGFLSRLPVNIESPSKMDPHPDYQIEFKCDVAVSIFDIMGLTT